MRHILSLSLSLVAFGCAVETATAIQDAPVEGPETGVEDTLWKKLCGTDYVLDNGWPGYALRFFEDTANPPKIERLCRQYTFGSGKPLTGEKVFSVMLNGNKIAVGDSHYTFDPATMTLTPENGKPVTPDDSRLKDLLRIMDAKKK